MPYSSEDRLSTDNAALILIDHQTGLLSACKDIPVERLRHNIIGLAKVGKLFELPVVLTQGGYGGLNAGGPLIAELVELFPDVPIIDRHHPNAWDALTTQATMIRLAHHGVDVVNWIAVWGELYRDHNSAMEQQIMGVMAEHMPGLGFVTNNWMFANRMYPDISDRLLRDEQPPQH